MTTLETLYRIPSRPYRWVGWLAVSQLVVALLWWRLGWAWGLPALLLSHALFVAPVFLPRARLYAPVVSRLPGHGPQVWLTIDDGPSDDTVAMLDLLDAHRASATFFVVGERAAQRPELVREIVRRGHGIGNHSHSHPQAWFWALGPRRMAREIGDAQQALADVTGQAPRLYRSVVGMTNPFVAAALREHGLTRVAWSARGFDGVRCEPDTTVARIVRDLVPGAIVLLHEGAAHGHNVTILRGVLEAMQARGLIARRPD
ncbi:polysaccharide deacetylase family protein [Xanthomonas campestris pv. raphani]|uniref:polysaccharide deacetylase family protein n=1 Tax=Xanthomonas campestris TaxID=339 RepID=UPI001E388054|nr:polysaccharide deacetylase family protein [Xanthomonas campestris]MCC8686097.1 polysaccharide deacetylase family protein [Xanthomonas campestris]MCW1998209.1 peptidoglycan/xylan/chitin deacetylase (PgdA/CDA1 family) [Xanthomonas campestris]MEA9677667.1 polysaccharide deacetylase family protein [Xanthomonas campestris pv. raphani]MEA9697753.1 polysaccharide deacetylase family protein [Xanthomonas campestris pv. raphani]MEA9779693.1 polysaccharide deacetylase family protein [Xanthomonas campe